MKIGKHKIPLEEMEMLWRVLNSGDEWDEQGTFRWIGGTVQEEADMLFSNIREKILYALDAHASEWKGVRCAAAFRARIDSMHADEVAVLAYRVRELFA